jgi:predicted phage-related endonuclease
MTTTTIDLPERAVWLEFRERYWNASDTAALFGEHPYVTLADVAVRKLTGKRQAENAGMSRGHRLEAAVAEWWSDEHGIAVFPADRLFLHDELVLATPDYLIVGCDDECVEVKTTARTVLEPEPYWWWQCQAQMLAGDLARVHLAVLDRSMDLQCWIVERDDQALARIVEQARTFMTAIRAGEMPEDVVLTYDHHLALHPVSVATIVDLDDGQAALVRRLDAARRMKRTAEAEEERVRSELAAVLGDADTAQHDGRAVLTWKTSTRDRLDERELRHHHPELVAAFTTTASYRTMRILT